MTTETITGELHHVSAVTSDIQTLVDAANLMHISTKIATYVIADGDELIRCNGTFTVTLPKATGSGVLYAVKNIGTGVITVDADGVETIDGSANYTLAQYDSIVVCDSLLGAWDII